MLARGMPHYHVVKLEVIILITKIRGFLLIIFNLFETYYYNFNNNNISVPKNPLVIILIIVTKS
jgi:hypothetical protein